MSILLHIILLSLSVNRISIRSLKSIRIYCSGFNVFFIVPNSKFRGTSDDPLPEEYKWIYSYDNNGNLIQKTSKQILGTLIKFTFNSDNQLVKIEEFKNNVKTKTVVYTYDALGPRVAKDIVDHQDASPVWRPMVGGIMLQKQWYGVRCFQWGKKCDLKKVVHRVFAVVS